jgi:hypothetical protein
MAERLADKFVSDLYLGSSGTPTDVLHPAWKAIGRELETNSRRFIVPSSGNWMTPTKSSTRRSSVSEKTAIEITKIDCLCYIQ